MNETPGDSLEVNRRDFLKGGSVATLMTMLGGVELLGQTNAPPGGDILPIEKVKVAVIGLGAWGREILNTLARLPEADIAAICDTYAAFVKRSAKDAPAAAQTNDYQTILDNKDIPAVVIATPTHAHKEIVLAALKAGKHVYCEAPLANTIADAREIARAAQAAEAQIFQAGLQLRSDPQRLFLRKFLRSGAIGQPLMARAQWHKKQSWRSTSSNAEREKAMNWRLSQETSLGLIGEMGCHQIDESNWFLNSHPLAVTGFGSLLFHKDGRDVPDTVQAVFEYPGGVNLSYDATLANSFEGNYEVFHGSDAAIMVRQDKAWLFKEVDAPLLGWEIYASSETFYKENGIALVADASVSVKKKAAEELPFTNTPLSHALGNFLRNGLDLSAAEKRAREAFKDDREALLEELSNARKLNRAAAGYLEAYQATILAIKANEAVMGRKRVELKPEMYELA